MRARLGAAPPPALSLAHWQAAGEQQRLLYGDIVLGGESESFLAADGFREVGEIAVVAAAGFREFHVLIALLVFAVGGVESEPGGGGLERLNLQRALGAADDEVAPR